MLNVFLRIHAVWSCMLCRQILRKNVHVTENDGPSVEREKKNKSKYCRRFQGRLKCVICLEITVCMAGTNGQEARTIGSGQADQRTPCGLSVVQGSLLGHAEVGLSQGWLDSGAYLLFCFQALGIAYRPTL